MTETYTSAAEVAELPPEQAHMLGQILLEEGGFARLSAKDQALVCAIAHRVHSTQDANEAFELQTTFGQRLADRVAEVGGSWGFVISFGIFLFIWAMLNLVILQGQARFDPIHARSDPSTHHHDGAKSPSRKRSPDHTDGL